MLPSSPYLRSALGRWPLANNNTFFSDSGNTNQYFFFLLLWSDCWTLVSSKRYSIKTNKSNNICVYILWWLNLLCPWLRKNIGFLPGRTCSDKRCYFYELLGAVRFNMFKFFSLFFTFQSVSTGFFWNHGDSGRSKTLPLSKYTLSSICLFVFTQMTTFIVPHKDFFAKNMLLSFVHCSGYTELPSKSNIYQLCTLEG